jgi:hypothetical protein
MSKLLKLKEWLTLIDAARHLSIILGEEVSQSDVLRLGLDGHLELSVNLVNHAEALRGKVVPIAEAKYKEAAKLTGVGTVRLYEGPVLFSKGQETHVVELEKRIVHLGGVFDLPMYGSERLDVEHRYQQLTGGPAVTLQGIDGTFVTKNEETFQLQTDFDNSEYYSGSKASLHVLENHIAIKGIEESEAQKLLDKYQQDRKLYLEKRASGDNMDHYFPAGGLPDDAILVVRMAALRDFEQSINDNQNELTKPITTTERNTLLAIIAGLCEYSAINPSERGVADKIAVMTQERGAAVSSETIRKVLAKIPEALETRMK